jgi:ubiquinone/menaquinone biosynthesis C-methylase UbiE
MAEICSPSTSPTESSLGATAPGSDLDTVPAYLLAHYWWAYIHPYAVDVFERQWLVNLILWGNYARLRDAALDELGGGLPGTTLQVACAYGDLSVDAAERAAAEGGRLDIVDVLPIQLQNLRRKLPAKSPVRLLRMDSARLRLPDASYDQALLFFLLHEQPPHVRMQTLREVFRVVKPAGKIVIVDYARPRWWHPLRYLWRPLLAILEPFALDLWRKDISDWVAKSGAGRASWRSFFGGLYQITVVTRSDACNRPDELIEGHEGPLRQKCGSGRRTRRQWL